MKTTTSTATQYAPIYRNTAAYARENGEQRLYFASRNANEDCAHAIGKAINAHYDGCHLDTDAIIETVTAECGAERVTYVLANTAQVMAEDGRMSRANFEWAQTIDVTIDRDRNAGFAVTAELAHATLVDALITAYRKALETAQTEPETVETTAAPAAAEAAKKTTTAAQKPAEAAEPETIASAPAAAAKPHRVRFADLLNHFDKTTGQLDPDFVGTITPTEPTGNPVVIDTGLARLAIRERGENALFSSLEDANGRTIAFWARPMLDALHTLHLDVFDRVTIYEYRCCADDSFEVYCMYDPYSAHRCCLLPSGLGLRFYPDGIKTRAV